MKRIQTLQKNLIKLVLHFNKFFLTVVFLIQFNSASANNNVVYLDVQYIIDNSDIGLFYKNKIKIINDKFKIELSKKEQILKEKENNIKNKKNILKSEELKKFSVDLENSVKEYRNFRNENTKMILNEKKKYSSKILMILNPLLTNFVEKNNIKLVLEKKNILVGAKVLDITQNIMTILNNETKKNNYLDEN